MIVNPGTPMTNRALKLRRARNAGPTPEARPHVALEERERRRLSGHRQKGHEGRFFLGSDGTLYEVIE
jgi:hypothetical protein